MGFKLDPNKEVNSTKRIWVIRRGQPFVLMCRGGEDYGGERAGSRSGLQRTQSSMCRDTVKFHNIFKRRRRIFNVSLVS